MKNFKSKQSQSGQSQAQQGDGNKNRFRGKNKYRNKSGYFKKRRFDNLPKIDREYMDLYKSFRRIQATIIRFVNPSSEEQLLWKYSSEFLSIKELLGQLIYNSENSLAHINHIISSTEGSLQVFDLSQQVKTEEFAERSLEILMSRFVAAKRSIEQVLKNSQNEDWEKSAVKADTEIKLKEVISNLISHDQTCLDAIFLNLQRHQIWYKPVEAPIEQTENTDTNPTNSSENPETKND